ncbi:hypothetical protein ACP275_05G133000 [Erythranthe tilingii]
MKFPPPVRQPPPPAARNHGRDVSLAAGSMEPKLNIVVANKEEGNSKKGGGKCNSVHVNIPSSKTNIESLPDELVFEILLRLSAEYNYDYAMVVCRKWYNMIHTHNFIYAHLENSPPGLLIRLDGDRKYPTFVSMVQGRVETSKIVPEFFEFGWSSCNGLTLELLESDHIDTDGLCIVNAATKQVFQLPLFGNFYPRAWDYSGIAYAAASMEYKVVSISDPKLLSNTPIALLGCAILTVGVDKSWRHVDIQHLSLKANELFKTTPLTAEGFLHWTSEKVGMTHILTLNVETEVIMEICLPQGCNDGVHKSRYFLSNGRSLTVFISRSEFSWDVWELKKPENGEWVKIIRIDLEGQKRKFERIAVPIVDLDPVPLTLVPIGWLNYDQGLVVQVCRPAEGCLVYDVGKQEVEILDLRMICYRIDSYVHKNSLVWLDG